MPYQFEKNGALKKLTAEELASADADSSVIELDQGTLQDGTPYWAYIAVKPSKYKEFKRMTAEHQPMCLTDYGSILKYGLDAHVPDSIKDEMKAYGCVDDYLAVLVADVKKAQGTFLKQQEDMYIGDIVAMLKKKKPNGA